MASAERFRILVVEDHDATRATLTRLLIQRGHEVE
jgi:CheY-like chemotaxis protein